MSAVLIADKLRASLLQAAIQGKLTKQLPEDGDARDLLKEIEAEKARLIEEKVIRKEKPLPPITEDEIPFEIPENWVWVRLGDIGISNTGTTPSTSQIENFGHFIPFIKPGSIYNFRIDYHLDGLSEVGMRRSRTVPENSLLMVCIGGSTGKCYFTDRKVAFNQQINALTPLNNLVSVKYLFFYVQSKTFQDTLWSISTGTATPIVNKEKWRNLPFSLPPLAEQHRIVEAIETALAKIDKLKTDEDKLYDIQKAFPNKLRASLLQSAIQGQLTEQLPEDGDARDLLKEIEAEKARLIEEKVIRKEKPLPPITEDEIPFEIPENWVWVRLGDLANKIHYGYTASAQDVGEIRLLRITDIQNNSVDWNAVPFCSPTDREKEAYLLTNNDIVIARTGGTIGKSFKISKLLGEAVFASYLIRVVPTLGALASYIDHYLDTPIYWEQLSNNTMGTGQPNVNATALKGLFIPLPPLAEQERIVKKLDEILGKVDGLKKITQ